MSRPERMVCAVCGAVPKRAIHDERVGRFLATDPGWTVERPPFGHPIFRCPDHDPRKADQ